MSRLEELQRQREELDIEIEFLKGSMLQPMTYEGEKCFVTKIAPVAQTEMGSLILSKQVRFLKVVQSLRDALGCGEDVQSSSGACFSLGYDLMLERWSTHSVFGMEWPGLVFRDQKHAIRVAKYLQAHYPGGFIDL